ncbi:MAG TPA: LysE family transporter [Spirochaetota bacterium]|nr:LysE family transporter [Spirochaetota bacterium]HRT76393.1 LysE family transporter [Spirochaetota bacterium]
MRYNLFISYGIAVVFGVVLGFLSAIPIGAVQLQVIKKAIRGLRKPAIMIALGSGTSDLIYGSLTLFGLGGFLASARFQLVFYLLGTAVLSFLLYHSIREYRHHVAAADIPPSGRKNEHAVGYMTGFTLAITNPSIVLWWIVGFKVFLDLGLFSEATFILRLVFVISGVTGLVGYLLILVVVIHRRHRDIPDRVFRRMNLGLIILFVVLIAYFVYKVAGFLCR